jgi:hypothetical protein
LKLTVPSAFVKLFVKEVAEEVAEVVAVVNAASVDEYAGRGTEIKGARRTNAVATRLVVIKPIDTHSFFDINIFKEERHGLLLKARKATVT